MPQCAERRLHGLDSVATVAAQRVQALLLLLLLLMRGSFESLSRRLTSGVMDQCRRDNSLILIVRQ